jgi:hypothetical protein
VAEAPTILFKSTRIEYNGRPVGGKILPLYEGDRVPFRVEIYDDQGEEVKAFIDFRDGTVESSDWLPSRSEVTFYHTWDRLGIYPVEIWTRDRSGHESLRRRVETVVTRHPGIADRQHIGMSNLNGLRGGFDEGYGREFMSRMADEGLNVIREHFTFHDLVVGNVDWHLEQIQKMFEFAHRNRIVVICSLFMFTRGHEGKGIRDHQHCGDRSEPVSNWIRRVAGLAAPYDHIIIDTGNEPAGTCEDHGYHRWIRHTARSAGAKRFCTQLPSLGSEFEFFNTHVHIDRPENLSSRPTGGKQDWHLFVESDTERYSRTTPDLAVRWLESVLGGGHSGIILSHGDTRIDDNVKHVIRAVGRFGRNNSLI